MAYRNDVDALAARATALGFEVKAKAEEVARAASLLSEARERAKLPVLDNIRIVSPCSADWDAMTGDERVRHCGACKKDVFNLSALTRDAAEALIREKHGELCGRYYQRKDGTIILADCTIGKSRKRKRFVIAAGVVTVFVIGGITRYVDHQHDATMDHEGHHDQVLGGAVSFAPAPVASQTLDVVKGRLVVERTQ
jgi:hypothetical protein